MAAYMYSKGFTLLEVVIILFLLAILFFFSFTNYSSTIISARRADGQTALFELANRLEAYYLKNFTYSGATMGENKSTDVMAGFSSQGWYKLKLVSVTDNAFSIAAIPQKSQVNDTKCQTLTLNSEGITGITSGPIGEPTRTKQDCWSS